MKKLNETISNALLYFIPVLLFEEELGKDRHSERGFGCYSQIRNRAVIIQYFKQLVLTIPLVIMASSAK